MSENEPKKCIFWYTFIKGIFQPFYTPKTKKIWNLLKIFPGFLRETFMLDGFLIGLIQTLFGDYWKFSKN